MRSSLVLVFVIGGASCSRPSAVPLLAAATTAVAPGQTDGLAFVLPDGWKKTGDRWLLNVHTVSLEGPHDAIAEILTMTRDNSTTMADLARKEAERRQAMLKKMESDDKSEDTTISIGGQATPAIHQSYTLSIAGVHVPHDVTYVTIEGRTRRVVVQTQVAADDAPKVTPALDAIRASVHVD